MVSIQCVSSYCIIVNQNLLIYSRTSGEAVEKVDDDDSDDDDESDDHADNA